MTETKQSQPKRAFHGHSPASGTTPTYGSWSAMKNRCDSPSNPRWNRYGGRGISYCPRWKKFTNFLEDMGERPKGMSIDRIDNDGNYEPLNCRWATRRQQVQNSTTVREITALGRTLPLVEWQRITGISRHTIGQRLNKYGWTPEDAVSFPPQIHRGRRIHPIVTT